MTFGDFAQTRLREQAGSGHTDRTQSGREHDLGAHLFSDPLSALPLFGVHAGTLEEFRGRLIAKGLKIGTINKVCGRIKSIAQEAFDRGLVDGRVTPFARFKHLRDHTRRKADPFTPDELVRIFAAAPDPTRRLYYLQQALTGLRPSEGLGVCWDCVDLDKGVLYVRRQTLEKGEVTDVLKTVGAERAVVMFPPLVSAYAVFIAASVIKLDWTPLSDLITLLPKKGPVFTFTKRHGLPLLERTEGDHPWRRTLDRAGVPYRPLVNMRHTYASLMLSAGKPVQWIAAQLGHTTVRKIQDTYGRWMYTPDSERLDLAEFFGRIENEHRQLGCLSQTAD